MKRMKSILALALVLVLTLSLSATVWADDTGSITISNPVDGQTYSIYEILYLESYNAETKAYAYQATTAWKDFINSTAIKGVYVNVDDQGYVTWKDGADVVAFAKLAQAEAKAKNITAQGTATAAKGADDKVAAIKFENLNLGYYLLDSTLGTLCSLDTTNPDATVIEKNSVPSNDKTVKEGDSYGKVNDANVGDTVSFKSTVKLSQGAENVVFYDTMTEGLTLNKDSITVGNLTTDDYTIGYTGATFTVTFAQKYLDNLTAETTIDITYDAVLNEKAVVAGNGNINESYLKYGDSTNSKETPHTTTKTYTWQFDVFKYTMNGTDKKALATAEFVLCKTENGTTYYAKADASYKITGWTATENDATKFVTPESGEFTVSGIDSGSYSLVETKAPAGYNKLKDPVAFTIVKTVDSNGNSATVAVKQGETAVEKIEVLNQTGAELPSTGGMGTTIFYLAGALLVIMATVMLVTRKRMGKAED